MLPVFRAFGVALTVVASPLHAQRSLASPRPAPWIPFRWQADTMGGHVEPHAFLYVPVTLDGVAGTYFLQLDTGAGWPRWYEVPMRQLLPRALRVPGRDTAADEVLMRGRIGHVALSRDTFLIEKGFGDSLPLKRGVASAPRVIGTLGLRFFRDRLLVLDFPHRRFAIVARDEALPIDVPRDVSYVPARYEHGYLFVSMTLAGRTVNDFFFDTGASSFALETTAASWRTLTGRTGNEADNRRMQVSSWGKLVEDIGAPLAGDAVIGPVHVSRPLVFHQREVAGAPDFFARDPNHSGGLFGNAMFADAHVVIVDIPRRRFGIAVATSP